MFDVKSAYTPKIERLKSIILKRAAFPEAMELALETHALTHCSEVSGGKASTYEDEILAGLADGDFIQMPPVPPGDALTRRLLFWGKKTVGGLILLPLTRHHVMHLDVCAKLKEKIKGQ
ncbi:MAG: hypothetical protein FWF99_00435 [Desulfovibrionaceae bacterium]|nr:hypothetical protein [Desulfovibrionaceae bacterium]